MPSGRSFTARIQAENSQGGRGGQRVRRHRCPTASRGIVLLSLGHVAARTAGRRSTSPRPETRGPKPKHDPNAQELHKLRRRESALTESLRRAEVVIDVQKVGAVGVATCRRNPGNLVEAVLALAPTVGLQAAAC
jgi:hypothetical protein